ncbi:acyl-CoA thioesterase [Sediminibacterium soli]|uniref:acyl-CoA thioesterase n=1 Tax=Sediminibacterium soli TaxID=2698829 RepID=UPI00137AB782|nr:thioesterase family protein [Sediminibacterium soli]NCI46131.1 acyl-CoA thioesterase [Sediminibacterium soli]
MNHYSKPIQVRWSDLDPNFHVRHSVYYDWGAFVRIALLTESGLTPAEMMKAQIGPILFREECIFKKEVHYNDSLEMTVEITKSTRDGGRWTMVHELWKNKEIRCAVLTVDGAWMDAVKRKLAVLPDHFRERFAHFPRSAQFAWTEGKTGSGE